MIALESGPQRHFVINVNFDANELADLRACASKIGVKPIYLVLYAVDLLGEAIEDSPQVVDFVKEDSLARASKHGGDRVNYCSQLSVPASWSDPVVRLKVQNNIPASHTFRFATITLLSAFQDQGVAEAAKEFCDNFAAFSLSKVKKSRFMQRKLAEKLAPPAHRGFIVYDPSKFRST